MELSNLLSAAVSNPNPDVRELGMLLLAELSQVMGENIIGIAPAMKGPVTAGLQDVDQRVRRAALKTLLQLLVDVEDDAIHELYADVFVPLMAVTQQCLGGAVGGAGG